MRYRPYKGKRLNRLPLLLIILLCVAVLAAVYLWFFSGKFPAAPASGTPEVSPSVSPTPTPTPSPSPSPTPSVPEPATPSPSAPAELPWNLTLVNASHPLPEDFAVITESLDDTHSFDARAIGALNKMLSDCQAAGLQPLVCSSYRSTDTQTVLFQRQLDQYMAGGMTYEEAYAATAEEIAIPGTSEHSLGLAADIVDVSNQNLDESQENTAVQKWLMEHCGEYGFILRYPKDKKEVTGIIYEPWHYRYVGMEYAQKITDSGLCLEEYLAREFGVE